MPTTEKTYFDKIMADTVDDLKDIDPERFIPCKGTLLIVVPPKVEKIGSIYLPDSAGEMEQRCLAKIAAVPLGWYMGTGGKDPEDELVAIDNKFKPGMWILFRAGSADPVKFFNRTDLMLLSYTNDVDSNVLGIIKGDLEREGWELEKDLTEEVDLAK